MRLRLLLAGCLSLAPLFAAAQDAPDAQPAGGKVEWARLKTSSRSWDRHAESDPRLLEFIRESTTLNIDPIWKSADVENLAQMTSYPFLFSEGIQYVTDDPGRRNLHEYVQRGGFLFIDSCINTNINPDPDRFLQMQIATLQAIFPGVHVDPVAPNHEIFSDCFEMKDGLPHTYMNNIYNEAWARQPLQKVTYQNRFIGLISLSGLQCGWAAMNPDPEHIHDCMKMMVNIYVYAITH
jgi:hypothetical protein